MQNPGCVRSLESAHDGFEDRDQAIERNFAVIELDREQVIVEVHALQELHDQAQLACVTAEHVEQFDGGGALERAHRRLLAHQPLHGMRFADGIRAEDLDGHHALHPAIGRAVDRALPTATDHLDQLVALAKQLTASVLECRHERQCITGRSLGRSRHDCATRDHKPPVRPCEIRMKTSALRMGVARPERKPVHRLDSFAIRVIP